MDLARPEPRRVRRRRAGGRSTAVIRYPYGEGRGRSRPAAGERTRPMSEVRDLALRAREAARHLALDLLGPAQRRAARDGRRPRGARSRDPRGQRRRHGRRRRGRDAGSAARPPHAGHEQAPGDRRGAARARPRVRPHRRGRHGPAPRQRHLAPAGARAARRGRDDLRGAAQRHRRRGRSRHQDGQRRDPARRLAGRALEHHHDRRCSPTPSPPRGCPRDSVQQVAGHEPRERQRAHGPPRAHRRAHPARRRRPHQVRRRRTPRCPRSRPASATATSTCTSTPTWRWRCPSS